ncbi:MAG: DUF4198 domain-containing protein [Planctomycetes bacterium]|nr:DUF4198 domain-containing protein [Planctomycetota bacterium]
MHLLRSSIAIAASWALVLGPVAAHETWAERVILIHYGEPGGPLDPYKPEQISAVAAIAADGSPLAVTARAVGGAAVAVDSPAGDPAAVFYTMQLGHYVITGEEWTTATAEAAAAAAKSWSGSFTATSILSWHPELARQRGRSIELVPLVDPDSLAAGQPLPMRAYRDGRPVAGVQVHQGEGVPPLRSDAAGDLAVPLRHGHQVIIGSLDEVDGGRTTGHLAVLSFTRR